MRTVYKNVVIDDRLTDLTVEGGKILSFDKDYD